MSVPNLPTTTPNPFAGLNLSAIYQGPSGIPPTGVFLTFERDEPTTKWLWASIPICFVFAMATFAMRLYTKLRIMKKWGHEDYVYVLAQLLYITFMSVTCKAVSPGAWHIWNVRVFHAHFFLFWYRLVAIIYEFAIAAIKVTILTEYIRIFSSNKRGGVFWSCIALMVISCVSGLLSGLLEIFHCLPINKQLQPLLLVNPFYGHCFDIDAARIGFSAALVIQDIAILIIPQVVIWKLKMSFRKRLGVSGLFGLGLGACAASSIRLYFTIRVKKGNDELWNLMLLGVCLVLEATIGIIIASLPVSPKFYQFVRDSPFGSRIKHYIGSTTNLASIRSRLSKKSGTSGGASAQSTGQEKLQTTQNTDSTGQTLVNPQSSTSMSQSMSMSQSVDIEAEADSLAADGGQSQPAQHVPKSLQWTVTPQEGSAQDNRIKRKPVWPGRI